MGETRSETVREARRREDADGDGGRERKPRQGERTAKTGGTDRDPDPGTGDLRDDQRLKGGTTGSSG